MKTKNLFNILLLILIFVTLTACGGGSGASTETTTSASTSSDIFSSGFVGKFIDYPVSGLDYSCDGTIKKTNNQGLFNCQNTPIDFFLGNLKLGSITKMPDDNLVFPQNILGEPRSAALHPRVTKMAILLQSLDSDGNPFNGIDIKQNTLEILNRFISSNADLEDFTLQELKDKIDAVVENDTQNKLIAVTAQQAQDHMLMSISKTYESPIQP